MKRVAIYGASGYTGLELLRLLARHPNAEVTALGTRQDDSPHIAEVHPSLTGSYDLRLERLTADQTAERAEVVFACMPHGASAEAVSELLDRGLKVVDLSADYRLTDRAVYEQWYGVIHPDPARIGHTPYGLPELYRGRIAEAPLVANPGCFPTGAILALAPLLKAGLVERQGIVIDSKTGVTGGGRKPKPAFHYPECNESVTAYGVGAHRHTPEIDQVLTDAGGDAVEVVFTPHLTAMDRGLLTTCYAAAADGATADSLNAALNDAYRDEPFVAVVDQPPASKHVVGTNRCHVFATAVRAGEKTTAVVISAIDNLLKGASGAAVQNFNLMCGFEETTALR